MILAPTRRVDLGAAALAIALAAAPNAHAQLLYGTLTGNVTDSTGGALAGATVQVVNVATGVAKDTISDARGTFIFSDLIPGVYDVSFQLSGFKGLSHKGVRIESNTVRRLDVPLEVSGVEENVSVSASALAIQTDRADLACHSRWPVAIARQLAPHRPHISAQLRMTRSCSPSRSHDAAHRSQASAQAPQ